MWVARKRWEELHRRLSDLATEDYVRRRFEGADIMYATLVRRVDALERSKRIADDIPGDAVALLKEYGFKDCDIRWPDQGAGWQVTDCLRKTWLGRPA